MGLTKNGGLIHGTVKDYVHNLLSYLAQCLNKCDTYLGFDRYVCAVAILLHHPAVHL